MAERTNRVLPFSDVDSVMRVLDEPRRPQTIELEVAVKARLDESHLRSAVMRAADLHPMTRARQLAAGPFAPNDRWKLDPHLTADVVESVTVSNNVDATRDEFLSRHIDVAAGPPFRCLLVHASDGVDRIMLSVNHVAFDGIGALRLLRSISRAYAAERDPLPAVDPEEARRLISASARRAPANAPSTRSPARVRGDRSTGRAAFGVLHVDIDAGAARRVGDASVNDVLLAAAHLALERWIRSRGAPCERITLMMPVNERPATWRDDVVANLVQSASITSVARDRIDERALLAAVTAQTKRIKRDGVSPSIGAIPQRTPVVLRRLLPRLVDFGSQGTADTAVLSNLGVVDEQMWFGAPGRGLWFSPPPRQPVILTIGTVDRRGHAWPQPPVVQRLVLGRQRTISRDDAPRRPRGASTPARMTSRS